VTAREEVDQNTVSLGVGSFTLPTKKVGPLFKHAPHLDDFMASELSKFTEMNLVVHFMFDVSREDRRVWPHIRESVIWIRVNGEFISPYKIRQSYMDSPRPGINMVIDVISRVYSIRVTYKEILTVYSDIPIGNRVSS
jgi:hypothetical protein